MQYRKAKPSSHQSNLKLAAKHDRPGLAACFAGQEPVLLPLLAQVLDAKASIDELMADTARSFVEQLLVPSAQEVAGAKHAGKHTGDIRWHGTQRGRITLAERSLAIKRPRLRNETAEVAIPAYARLRDEARLGSRVRDILVSGVSTRQYARVLPAMAGAVGIKKSSVSRQFIQASERALAEPMQRRLDGIELLAIYLDGIVVDGHHIRSEKINLSPFSRSPFSRPRFLPALPNHAKITHTITRRAIF